MPIPTLKVLASLLQMHGPGATIQSDHQGIEALLRDIRGQISEDEIVRPTASAFVRGGGFRRGGFIRGGGFRRV